MYVITSPIFIPKATNHSILIKISIIILNKGNIYKVVLILNIIKRW